MVHRAIEPDKGTECAGVWVCSLMKVVSVCVCLNVCARGWVSVWLLECMYVCVCVCERERERERDCLDA